LRTACLLGAAVVLPLVASAAVAREQERVLESSRYLGRGNTFVAGYDSDEATRGNPATLGEANVKFQLRWLQLDLMVGENSLDSVQDVSELDGEESAVSVLNTFEDKFGKRQYLRVQAVPLAMRILKFEMMPFFTTSNYVDMRLPTTPELQFRSDTMAGVAFAFGYSVSAAWSLGMTVRPAHRTVFAGDVAFADLLNFIDDEDASLEDLFEKEEGLQVGVDVGTIWRPAKDWRFGLLVENLGYAGNQGDFEAPPDPYQQRVDLGLNYRVDWKPWHWDVLVDAQDLVNPEQYDWFRLLHVGTEIGRSYISRDHDIGLLAGLNEGYFTTGGFLDLFIARLQMTYYAVELGEYAGQRRDRRWAITLLSSMTF
jgi:hypothetical protein